jgi:hypothetical protein
MLGRHRDGDAEVMAEVSGEGSRDLAAPLMTCAGVEDPAFIRLQRPTPSIAIPKNCMLLERYCVLVNVGRYQIRSIATRLLPATSPI